MSELLINQEPNPEALFCRRRGLEFPEYLSLDEIRGEMDLIEPSFVALLAEHKSAMDTPKW